MVFAILGEKDGRESLTLIPGGLLNRGVATERSVYVCLRKVPDYQRRICTAFIRAVGRKTESRKPPTLVLHDKD